MGLLGEVQAIKVKDFSIDVESDSVEQSSVTSESRKTTESTTETYKDETHNSHYSTNSWDTDQSTGHELDNSVRMEDLGFTHGFGTGGDASDEGSAFHSPPAIFSAI